MNLSPEQAKLILRGRKARREKARRNILDFIKYTFKTYADENWHHHLITRHYQKAISGEIKRLMIFVGPRHGKTEMLERSMSWAYGHNPDLKIIGCAYGSKRATDSSKKINENIKDPKFYEVFHEHKGSEFFKTGSTDQQSQWSLGGGYRGGYLAAGVNGPIVGFGGKILIVDDPVKTRQDAESPIYQQATKEWYFGTLLNRQDDKDSTIIIINTRWNTKDLCGCILEIEGIKSYNGHKPSKGCPEWNGQQDGKWDILCLPTEMDEEGMLWKHPDDPRGVGDALWPQKFPSSFLEQFKGVKHDWYSLYQGRPKTKGGNLINGKWLTDNTVKPEQVPVGGKRVRFADLAATEKKVGAKGKINDPDFTASGHVQYVDGKFYIWHVSACQKSPLARDKDLLAHAKKDKHDFGDKVLITWEEEGGASGKDVTEKYKILFKDFLRQPTRVGKSKKFYVDLFANKAETGDVYIVDYRGWIQEKHDNNTFIDECEMFPSPLCHDDRIDAVAKACFVASGGAIEELGSPDVMERPKEDKSIMEQVEEAVLNKTELPGVEGVERILEAIADKYVNEGDAEKADLFLDEVDKIPHYFNLENAPENDINLKMAKGQGYVPVNCLLNGNVVMGLVNDGKDPCKGCNCNRDKCGGRN